MKECEKTGRIHSIESFGTVDGPGIRYVVFFQGCRLRCRYCHNPDTWKLSGGQEMTAEEILCGMERSRAFYRQGGLTCSGGEPLLQLPFLVQLLKEAKHRGSHTCLDTSGIPLPEYERCFACAVRADEESTNPAEELFAALDLILMDFKHAEEAGHLQLTGQPQGPALCFARAAERCGVPMTARHVLVPGITDGEEKLRALGRLLGTFSNLCTVEVLPYHRMGEKKYEELGIPYLLKGTPALQRTDAQRAREKIVRAMRESGREL